jgi:hypothetical protein
MYEIQILRVNAMGGVTRGTRTASTNDELLHWVKTITGPEQTDNLIEFTVRTVGSDYVSSK